MAGLTSEGLQIKRLPELRTDLEAAVKAELGADVKTDDTSVLGHLLGLFAAALAEAWEGLEGVVDGFNPEAAQGKALDELCALVGVARQGATKARGVVNCNGTVGVVLPAGKVVKASSTGRTFVLVETVTIELGGTVQAEVEAEEAGEGTAAGIDQIVTPVPGWTEVNTATVVEDGTDAESDAALRLRRQQSLRLVGAAADQAIAARVLQLDAVEACRVRSNRTSSAVDGIPAHGFRVVVWPSGLDADTEAAVARAIWETQPAGIESGGSEVHTVTDSQGYSQTVKFSYASPVNLYVKVTLTTNSRYPADGAAQVQAAVRAVFEGMDAEDVQTAQELALFNLVGTGLTVGDDATVLKLACAVATVPGVVGATILLDDVNPPVAAVDYALDDDEIAHLALDAEVVEA